MTAITITSTGYRLMAAKLLPPPFSSTPSSLQSGVLRRGGRTQEQVEGSQEVGEVQERGAPLHLQEQEEGETVRKKNAHFVRNAATRRGIGIAGEHCDRLVGLTGVGDASGFDDFVAVPDLLERTHLHATHTSTRSVESPSRHPTSAGSAWYVCMPELHLTVSVTWMLRPDGKYVSSKVLI